MIKSKLLNFKIQSPKLIVYGCTCTHHQWCRMVRLLAAHLVVQLDSAHLVVQLDSAHLVVQLDSAPDECATSLS
jgi:hypothetical protein